jgi:GT2 family glycosyltransferase
MNAVDVIIPTLKRIHAFKAFESLQHIPFPINLHVVTGGDTWAAAINIGLRQCSGQNDVLIMDDDVHILPGTFLDFDQFSDAGDILGFKLLYPDGKIQHAGGFYSPSQGVMNHLGYGRDQSDPESAEPRYVCHVTTSLAYVKRYVLDALGGMAEDIPGMQFEDVDFSFRALKKGFKIFYVPRPAIHMESASKRFLPGFSSGMGKAWASVRDRHFANDPDFEKSLAKYPRSFVEGALVA